MRNFKRDLFRTAEEESGEITGYCVEWTAQNDGNIKMKLHGSVDFTTFLAGRTITTLDGIVYQYTIDGNNVACSIPITHNSNTVFFDTSSLLPVVTDEVLTQIFVTLDVAISDGSFQYFNFQWAAEEFPDQYHAEYDECF